MIFRRASGFCAGIALALLLGVPHLVQAGPADNADGKWQPVGKGHYEKVPGWKTTHAPHKGRPHVGRGPKGAPPGEVPVAPVPEPGTMTLAAFGLMAVGAAVRKRRDAGASKGPTTS